MPFNKKSVLALWGAGALLFSMSALANNPAPSDPGDSGGGSAYQRGPDPSVSFLEADRGQYSVRTSRVSSLVSGFGGGTIHYPAGTTGTMAAIVVAAAVFVVGSLIARGINLITSLFGGIFTTPRGDRRRNVRVIQRP